MPQSTFVSYAQNGEDVLLWRALNGVSRGFYIDVGAQDPVVDSVTKAFYERGWHGINIEPVQHWYERLVADRPHDINLQRAVSDRPGVLKLFEVVDSGLSTSDAEFARRHAAEGHALTERAIECVTLDQVCADHHIGTVHFLKIDCEGAEKAALESIALKDVRPWIILLEATEPNSTTPTWQQWQHLLTERGYRYVFFDGLNRYYVADEHSDLADAFAAPVNVFDKVQRRTEVEAQRQLGQLRSEVAVLRGATNHAILLAELKAAENERSRVTHERDFARAERASMAIWRDKVVAERNAAVAERNQMAGERASMALWRDKVTTERNAAISARDQVAQERDRIAGERDALSAERDRIAGERDALSAERDRIAGERDRVAREKEGAIVERDQLRREQAALLASHSWRVTAPLRGCSRTARWCLRRLRHGARVVLRPVAHAARPTLKRLAGHPTVRAVVVRVFGRNSHLTNTARLFLFGTGTFRSVAAAVVPTPVAPTAQSESLSARGQDALILLEGKRMESTGER